MKLGVSLRCELFLWNAYACPFRFQNISPVMRSLIFFYRSVSVSGPEFSVGIAPKDPASVITVGYSGFGSYFDSKSLPAGNLGDSGAYCGFEEASWFRLNFRL